MDVVLWRGFQLSRRAARNHMSLPRLIEPEWLDELPPTDLRARHARRDLQRVNFVMGNVRILRRTLIRYLSTDGPLTLIELGAGDGISMLTLAHQLSAHFGRKRWPINTILVDRRLHVARETLDQLQALGWTTECVTADVFDWLPMAAEGNVILCNLLLHHFPPRLLVDLLAVGAQKSALFLACEPARSRLSLYCSYLLGIIGCNDVTRHDAVASVHAGFSHQEISSHWPDRTQWNLEEHRAGLFSHLFIAQRRELASE